MNDAVHTYMQSIYRTVSEFAKGLLTKQTLRPDLYTSDQHPQVSGELCEFILTQVFPLDHIFNSKNISAGIYDINKKKKMLSEFSYEISLNDLALENLLRVHDNLLVFLQNYCSSFGLEPTKENIDEVLVNFREYNGSLVKGVKSLNNPKYLETLNAFVWVLSSLADWIGVEYLEPIDVITAAFILCPSSVDPRKFFLKDDQHLQKLREIKTEMYDIFVTNKLYLSDPTLYKLAVIILNIVVYDIPLTPYLTTTTTATRTI